MFQRFCKMFLRVPQAAGQYCSCHVAQVSNGNFQKTYNRTFGTSGRPSQYCLPTNLGYFLPPLPFWADVIYGCPQMLNLCEYQHGHGDMDRRTWGFEDFLGSVLPNCLPSSLALNDPSIDSENFAFSLSLIARGTAQLYWGCVIRLHIRHAIRRFLVDNLAEVWAQES